MQWVLCVFMAVLFAAAGSPYAAWSQTASPQRESPAEPPALQSLKAQIEALKSEYGKRIRELEAQVEELQLQMLRAAAEAVPAQPLPSVSQTTPSALNPAFTVIGNFLARADGGKVFNDEGARIDNRLNLRETELDMRLAVDPYADGVVIAAIESESPGEFSTTIEEGYVTIKRLPFLDRSLLGLKLKAGRFRPSFGSSNILHTHDLPQSFRPLPVQEFLGEEGFIQSGVSGSFFLPTPWDKNSSLEATLQMVGGGELAFAPDTSGRNAYLGRISWFRSFQNSHTLSLGGSGYYRPSGNNLDQADLYGFDFTYRWRPLRGGQWRSFILGSEMFLARRAYGEGASAADFPSPTGESLSGSGRPFGFTIFGQWQFDRRKYGGVRFDQTDTLSDTALKRRSFTSYLSYYFSEFLRLRLSYERRWSDLLSEKRRNSFFAELNFVFGSHPPEPYWVNK